MKLVQCEKGIIPVVVIIAIAIASTLFGGAMVAWLSGSAKTGIFMFILGVIMGLIVLPNLRKIIRWGKDVKKEF